MTNDEYMAAISMVRSMATMAVSVDWTAAIDRASIASSVGPMLDPTLYMRSIDTHELIVDGLRAAREFATKIQSIESAFREAIK